MVGRDTAPRWVNPVTHLHKEHDLTWRTPTCIDGSPRARGRATKLPFVVEKDYKMQQKALILKASAQLFPTVITFQETSYRNAARFLQTGWTLIFFKHQFGFFFSLKKN